MARHRRANHLFVTWKGDHSPRHVHIYRGKHLIAKWDLDNGRVMEGKSAQGFGRSSPNWWQKENYENKEGRIEQPQKELRD